MNRRMHNRCITLTLAALVCFGTLMGASHARVIRVRRDAPGPVHDGTSWAQAYSTVTEALTAANNLDEIWVAEGTYADRIKLKYGVTLYGGFAGTETGREQRDSSAHVTTLDGERKGTVIVASANAVNTVVDGFHIINGMREERTYSGPGYATITAQTGGAIFTEHARTLFANLVIRDCAGHGLDCRGESILTLRDSSISNCENSGIYCEDSTPLIMRNTIRGNGSNPAYGMYSAAISSRKSTPTIAGNLIVGNRYGVSLFDSPGTVINNTIVENWYPDTPVADAIGVTSFSNTTNPVIVNNIVAYNERGINYSIPYTAGLHHNLVAHNPLGDYYGISDPAVLAANISKAPAFVDRRGGDYHLSPISPCIDAGDDSLVQPGDTDMDGQERIQHEHVDIGADESAVPHREAVPRIVRVRADGDDANDGSTWAAAFRTVEAAHDVAYEGGGGEIWVAAGTYETRLTLYPGVSLYGGFLGREVTRDPRNPGLQETVLDGHGMGTVVAVRSGDGVASVIDGFTIRNGAPVGQGYGCGIVCEPGTAPLITRNIIRFNKGKAIPTPPSVGRPTGGIYSEHASPFLGGNVVLDNGGIGIFTSAGIPDIVNNTVIGNDGTGIRIEASPARVENNIISFNKAGFMADTVSQPTFRGNCVFGNGGYAFSGIDDLTGSDGNIATDPGLGSYTYGNWHLQKDSPCVDAGTPVGIPKLGWDIDGHARLLGEGVDIGADESIGTIWPTVSRTVRVSPTGHDDQSGVTWLAAKRTVGAAIEALRNTGGEVWVAAGTYTESVTLPPHIYLYGGFAGSELARDERCWKANKSTLQGDIVVVQAQYGYRSSAVDGFTIQSTSPEMKGTAILCDGSSPEIANNTLLLAGSGISGNGAPSVHDCEIRPADGALAAGGIQISSYDAPVTISNNVILHCGITLEQSGGTVANNAIIGATNGIYTRPSTVLTQSVINNTVLGCTRAGIDAAKTLIANNLVAFNKYGYLDVNRKTLVLRHNNSYGNESLNYPEGFLGTDGNISQDPMLISSDDAHIRPESPCRDAGDNALVTWTVDMDGQPRIEGDRVDIGADEVHPDLAFTLLDVRQALSVAAGLTNADPASMQRWNVVTAGGPEPVVDILDTVRLIRKAMWMEPNP